jgi:hypothetical protein
MRAALVRILPVCLLAVASSYDHAQSTSTQPTSTQPTSTQAAPASTVQPARVVGDVHSITPPYVPEPDLPQGPGRDAFMLSCTICHSNRYVTMQPHFSRKIWAAEVDKMRKTYGAPISDEQAAQSVDYLVSIRGKSDR